MRASAQVAALALAVTVVMFACPRAHAFTLDNQSGNNPDGSAKYVDPDEEVENFGRSDANRSQSGLQFGFGRPDQSRDRGNPVMRPLGPWSFGNGGND